MVEKLKILRLFLSANTALVFNSDESGAGADCTFRLRSRLHFTSTRQGAAARQVSFLD
jgi:hypothetical protein